MKKPRILIIDNNQSNIELLENILSKDYEIVKTLCGIDTIIKVEKTLTDIILLDMMMPAKTGIKLCKMIKNNPNTTSIPILMFTETKGGEDKLEVIESGADDFLSKPVDKYELLAKVRSLTRIKQYYNDLAQDRDRLLIFDSVLKCMDDCVLITNLSGHIRYVNPAFERKYAYSSDEITKLHISVIIHPESPQTLDKDSFIKDSKHEWTGNLATVNKHGLRINMSVKCSPVIKDGRHVNLVFVLREKEAVVIYEDPMKSKEVYDKILKVANKLMNGRET
ncbi:MAG: response regulator [Candidatus Methanoperedens sp.]|nr:response regulator [Candidatus Methanoperedens sp.]